MRNLGRRVGAGGPNLSSCHPFVRRWSVVGRHPSHVMRQAAVGKSAPLLVADKRLQVAGCKSQVDGVGGKRLFTCNLEPVTRKTTTDQRPPPLICPFQFSIRVSKRRQVAALPNLQPETWNLQPEPCNHSQKPSRLRATPLIVNRYSSLSTLPRPQRGSGKALPATEVSRVCPTPRPGPGKGRLSGPRRKRCSGGVR